ncbi:hypothetical protein [Kitasatospora sp. NPDC088351]|uniref:hypothetical protein n=1 Tax=Kitasatospora sp. NPDC088351 TaxID=3155180 RepID=UPI00341DC153
MARMHVSGGGSTGKTPPVQGKRKRTRPTATGAGSTDRTVWTPDVVVRCVLLVLNAAMRFFL